MEVVLATGFGYYANMTNDGEVDELIEASASVFRYNRENARRNFKILYCKRALDKAKDSV